tara:strand:+ start:391 stop:672 length:282 start_codon:yes stop_codon:yes gene_type:complete
MRNKEILRIQSRIINATAELQELGYTIDVKYLGGAGIVCELRNDANDQARIDAEQEKNNDYALDNMTSDETMVVDDVGQVYDPTEAWYVEDDK